MRCYSCAGKGWVRNEAATRELMPAVPCPRCGGSGWDHCCEGGDASCEVIVAEPRPVPAEALALLAPGPASELAARAS